MSMRRLFLSWLAILAAIGIHADNISVKDVMIEPGTTAIAEVCLDYPSELIALQMTLTLPENISLDREGCSLTDRAGNEMTLSIGKKRDYYTIIVSSTAATIFNGTDGAVLHLAFTASDDFEAAEATLSGIRVVDPAGNRIFLDDCTIRFMKPFPMGDVNHDRMVTITDVMMTVNAVVSSRPVGFYPENADMNGDHDINISDIMMIVKIIVGN